LSDEPAETRARRLPAPWVSTIVLVVGLILGYRDFFDASLSSLDLRESIEQAIYNPAEGTALLGLGVFLFLIYRRSAAILSACDDSARSWIRDVAVMVLGSSLLVWAHLTSTADLLVPALILQVASIALILGGRRLLGEVAIPLLALVVVIPLPAILVNLLVFPMQMVTVSLTSTLLDCVGRSHVVIGDLISTRGVLFQVVEGCSGLKSMFSLTLAGIAFADVTGRSRREKFVVISLAPVVGLLTNGFRVLILVLFEIGPESVEHTAFGLLMIVGGVLILAGLEWILARSVFVRWRRAETDHRTRDPIAPFSPIARRRLALVAVVVSSLSVLLLVAPVDAFGPAPGPRINIESLPLEFDEWTGRGIRMDRSFHGSVWFRHRIYRAYEKDGSTVRVFIGLEDVAARRRSGYSPKTAIPRMGWRSIEENAVSNSPPGNPVQLVIRYPRMSVLVDHWREGYAPWGFEIFSSWLNVDRQNFGGSASVFVIRLETEIVDNDRESARLRLRQVRAFVENWTRRLGGSRETGDSRT
jgi:exosortase